MSSGILWRSTIPAHIGSANTQPREGRKRKGRPEATYPVSPPRRACWSLPPASTIKHSCLFLALSISKRIVYIRVTYEWHKLSLHRTNQTSQNETNPKTKTKHVSQEIFERFFGTHNPFVDFGFGDTMPFASRLKKQGPHKPDPVARDLACSLEELYNGCTKALKVTRKVSSRVLSSRAVRRLRQGVQGQKEKGTHVLPVKRTYRL